MATKISKKQMQATKPSLPVNWDRSEVNEIALANAVMAWDQHSGESEEQRESAAAAYAQNAADTCVEEGLGDAAWLAASTATIDLLRMIGFCK